MNIHYFDFRGQALCGSSNDEDGDEPASHEIAEVTCEKCLLAVARTLVVHVVKAS